MAVAEWKYSETVEFADCLREGLIPYFRRPPTHTYVHAQNRYVRYVYLHTQYTYVRSTAVFY